MEPVVDPMVEPLDERVALDPDYRRLYYRWEREQWSAGAIDLTEDRRQWADVFTPDRRRAIRWALSSFSISDEITDMLVPFVDAAPTEEQQVFLTTQLADSARHIVFLDRFGSEVLVDDDGDVEARSGWQNDGWRVLSTEMLPAASEAIASDLGNMDRLVEGITLYHLVIEGTVALTGRQFLLDHARTNDRLPGWRRGSTAIARDEARHVDFATKFLRAMIVKDRHYADVVAGMLTTAVPGIRATFEPPGGDPSYFDALSYGPDDLKTAALDALAKCAELIGVEPVP